MLKFLFIHFLLVFKKKTIVVFFSNQIIYFVLYYILILLTPIRLYNTYNYIILDHLLFSLTNF